MTSTSKPTLIVVQGATASGKTGVAVELAKHFKTEIISADSRQFYKGMAIGTAQPTEKEMQGIPHHFVNFLDVQEEFTAGRFEEVVLDLLDKLFEKHSVVIMAGGSMMYVDAVLYGLDNIPRDKKIRQQLIDLFEKEGIEPLQTKLKDLDPDYYAEVDLQNQNRLMRAIEATLASGKPYSTLRSFKKKERPFNTVKVGIYRSREELYHRINKRVNQMVQDGIISEAKRLHSKKDLNALKTVGYQEVFDAFERKMTIDEAIDKIKQSTRKYAKKQITWLKKDDKIRWFAPDKVRDMINYIEDNV